MAYNIKDVQQHIIEAAGSQKRAMAPLISPAEVSESEIGTILSTESAYFFFSSQLKMPSEIKEATGNNTIAAIIDTGVNASHSDLIDKIIVTMDQDGNRKDDKKNHISVSDSNGHGTHLAGIIAGSRSERFPEIIGIAPQAKIVSIKVTNARGGSETSWWKISAALDQVIRFNNDKSNERKISAVTLAYNAFDNNYNFFPKHHTIWKQFQELYSDNVAVIVSGGNHYKEFFDEELKEIKKGVAYPANCGYVISAGAYINQAARPYLMGEIAPFTQRRNFSNFMLAPGCNTLSCWWDGNFSYSTLSGSSQAAAVITGMVLRYQQLYPTASVSAIKKRLKLAATFNLPSVQGTASINESRTYPHLEVK